MHALHSLAHRAPATRARVRWQPYTSITASSSSSSSSRLSSPSSYLNTPSSSVPSSPELVPSTQELDRIRQISLSLPPHPKEPLTRDTNRSKHATSIVDQAVKSLCEIWRPQDIPPAFVASARTMITGGNSYDSNPATPRKTPTRKHNRGQQLPSPISPSSQPSPPASMTPPAQSLSLPEQDLTGTSNSRGNLVPIRAFVHEVLRRSRTSGCVLQTALCYLEAIRAKVPELVEQERSGKGVKGEPDISDRIIPATEAELELEAETTIKYDLIMKTPDSCDDDIMATVRIHDNGQGQDTTSIGVTLLSQEDNAHYPQAHQRLPPCPGLPPLPPLPSPLLCPRRAFLASLILASKFTQDKCYSNRAWAKLSGLPPREIGRCERALGEALEWRLWVGKQPSLETLHAAPPTNRPVVRSQSESSVISVQPFLSKDEKPNILPTNLCASINRGIRRCATLPADAFRPAPSITSPPTQLHSASSHPSDLNDNINRIRNQLTITQAIPMKNVDSCVQVSECSQYAEKISQSPSPETPGLSYSPSSTESTSGDRTIQSTYFLDDSMGAFNPGQSGTNIPESWLWSDPSDTASCLPKTPSPHFPNPNAPCRMNPPDPFSPIPSVNALSSKAPHELVTTGARCPWVVENGMLTQS